MLSEKSPVKNDDPIYGAVAVTPHDTNFIFGGATQSGLARGLWVGGAGNVTVTMADGNDVLFSGVPAGTLLPIVFLRVKATGTTATLMTAGKRA